jgi:cell division protein FtsW (lipid II flippase)
MEETQSRLPLYVGIAVVAAYLWKRKRSKDEELETESERSKLISLIFVGLLLFCFKDNLGEVTRAVGPLVASNFVLKNNMGYVAASVAAVIVHLGVTPSLIKV